MSKDFHAEPFDAGTTKKLEIFRRYIRSWLPVFLAANKGYKNVALYDFFAGPGKDARGVAGSPLIIIEELKAYLGNPTKPHAQGIRVKLYFNDDDNNKYLELDKAIKAEKTSGLFDIEVANEDFGNAFEAKFSAISAPHTANLIILDQSGIKHVTEDVFRRLINCKTTDILFFISSAIINRFAGEQGIARYFPGISKEKIKELEPGHIHRFVCDYYRRLIPTAKAYYLAPFSIKKQANIYGVIFGTNHLRGLEKFLDVCWKLDPMTGEANYNIDGDAFWNEKTLFKELDTAQKMDEFQENLIVESQKKPMTNRDVYRYCVENGFLPKHANEILTALRRSGRLSLSPPDSRGFYIGWDYYCGNKDKVVTFVVKE